MTTPNTSISGLALSDINVELAYSSNTARAFNDGIFRSLTGNADRQANGIAISLADLSNKTAFGGIVSANSSNATSYGVIEREINLLANTDMYSCDVVWTATLISGVSGTFTTNGKSASYKITGVKEANVTSNVYVTATLSYQGHLIGSASKYIYFEINSLPPSLFVNGNTTVSVLAYEPTSIGTTLTATSNVANGATVQFTVTPKDNGVLISGNTVTLSSQALTAGVNNVRSYSVLTELIFNNQIIAQDLKQVSVTANYAVPDITMMVPATTNNTFANSGTVRSSLTLSGSHTVPNANLTWTAVKVSGDDAVLVVAANNGSANLSVNVSSDAFGTKKSVYDVTATLAYSNGQYITSRTNRLTLRTGSYGLSLVKNEGNSSGYTAQTATSSVSATAQTGTLTWTITKSSGDAATVANSVSGATGTVILTLTNDSVGTKAASYTVVPTLSYDGVVMTNTASVVNVSTQQIGYSYTLTGETSNSVIGDAPVTATLVAIASHNVAGGTVVFSKANTATVLVSNSTVATSTYTNNTLGTDTFSLLAVLYDSQSRVVEQKTLSQTLRAYYPNLSYLGANSASAIGYSDQTANVAAAIRLGNAGANSFVLTATKLDGADLVFASSGNTTYQSFTIGATQNTIGTSEGTYSIVATVTYFGKTYSQSYGTEVSVTKDDAMFTIAGSNGSVGSFNFPVTANASATVDHIVPDGTITWSRSGTGTVTANLVANATNYAFQTQQSNVGTLSANQTVVATLRDSAGALVGTQTVVLSTNAQRFDPALVLNGLSSNVVSNAFHAEASLTVTPAVNAALTGHTFQYSWSATSGSANVTSNTTAVSLSNVFDGSGSATGTYNVTCNVLLNGQTIASNTKAVTVTATCPAPTLNATGTNDSDASFNYPVTTVGYVDASSTPAGAVVTWSSSLVSGTAATLSTANSGNRYVITNAQSAVGSKSAVYDVTATYKTPNGTTLGTKVTRVTTTSNRYNAALALAYVNGSSASDNGFDERLDAIVAIKATANSSLSGHTYSISTAYVTGNMNQASFVLGTSNGYMSADYYNIRSTNGTTAKNAQYDFTVSIVLNGQTIAGPSVLRTYHTLTPGAVVNPGNLAVDAYVSSGTATATITFNPTGTVVLSGSDTTTKSWMSPSNTTEAAKYDIQFDSDTRLALSAARSKSVSATSNGKNGATRALNGTYVIRLTSSGATVASGTYSVEASSGILL